LRLVPHRSTVLQAAPRVQHPKFGVGRVLRATGGGPDRKLEIDFGGGGVRTILARFVTELPG
jgi:DNA helicase-2/ATP-dependent DNA helicase PcrA